MILIVGVIRNYILTFWQKMSYRQYCFQLVF